MQRTADAVRHQFHWYVVYCNPLREWQAAAALYEYLGLTVYLPETKRRFRGQVQWAPLFPRYLFVRADLHMVTVSRINAVPGVVRLVRYGEMPQAVPAREIEALRQQVDWLNSQGGLLEHGFHPGDNLRVKSGMFQGFDATFIGPMKPSERVRVLIQFLGHLREMELDSDLLERTKSVQPLKQERRTRGQGRVIKKK